jgi:DNA-binding winged helix-turn-helix (wHTH) protein/Tfp pilus assembly protein PilF
MDQDFRLGPWIVRPSLNSIALNGRIVRLEPKAMEVLVCLAKQQGNVVSKEQLISTVWAGTFVGDDALTRCISELRKAFDDDPKAPRMIETISKRGYRLLERVEPVAPEARRWTDYLASWSRKVRKEVAPRRRSMILVAVVGLALVFASLKLIPLIARYYNNRGVQLQQQGHIQEAIQNYLRAISLNSGYAEAHYNLGDAYEEIPNYDKALEQYQRAIDADLTFYPAYNNLSRLYILRRRDYGAALRLLERALSLNPREPSVRYSLYKNHGWANFELHNLVQAERDLRSAMAVNPHRGAAHCLLAKVLDDQGKATDALVEWESCVAFSASPEVEPEWRNEAQERLGKEPIK